LLMSRLAVTIVESGPHTVSYTKPVMVISGMYS
jgi:hypothetical protein